MKNNKEKYLLFGIVFLVALIFAYLITSLVINGDVTVGSNSWDVHFENINVVDGSVETDVGAVITDDTTIDLSVELNSPGDYYDFTVDVVNEGTLDAMIDDITIEGIDDYSNFLDVSMYYYDLHGENLNSNDLLKADSSISVYVSFKFKRNININDLIDEDVDASVSIGIDYVQADENASEVELFIYSDDDDMFEIGEVIPDGAHYYYSYNDIPSFEGEPYFIKMKIEDNVVSEAYLGFLYNGEVYYLKSGDGGESFDDNVALLISLFGSDSCNSVIDEDEERFICNPDSDTHFYFEITNSGYNYFGGETSSGVTKICSIYRYAIGCGFIN